MMKLSDFTKPQLRIIEELMKEEELLISQLTQRVGTNSKLINSYLNQLEVEGIVKKKSFGKKIRIYALDDHPTVNSFRKVILDLEAKEG